MYAKPTSAAAKQTDNRVAVKEGPAQARRRARQKRECGQCIIVLCRPRGKSFYGDARLLLTAMVSTLAPQ